jgi:alkanesulfonate monooxygenase SsuD/methylene tetrahydromethanopterin reductase-like flavin-dependent oxidoreductase (luciferase family)
MTEYGIHASHEQFPPSLLLSLVELAEELGFRAALSSDHLAPLSGEHDQAGFAWSWPPKAGPAAPEGVRADDP